MPVSVSEIDIAFSGAPSEARRCDRYDGQLPVQYRFSIVYSRTHSQKCTVVVIVWRLPTAVGVFQTGTRPHNLIMQGDNTPRVTFSRLDGNRIRPPRFDCLQELQSAVCSIKMQPTIGEGS